MKKDYLKEKGLQMGEKIGEGAFGQVYKGIFREQEVAIKVMHGAQFQETSIMENLKHQNVIKLYKYFKQGNNQYLVMEYASGGSLSEYMKQDLTENIISEIMKSLFKAVEYLHSKQIIHRDIKPDNILIKDREDLASIKLADFGLSYQYMAEIRYYQKVSQQCGTFIFMAPEQILNKSYNKAVDIWSCGIVLYMLLNKGKHPFYPKYPTKKEFSECFPHLKYEQPLHASSLARDLLQRLLQYDQDSRYTASQALVHPWITRQYTDPIPMSVKEFGKCQEQQKEVQFFVIQVFYLIKTLMFLSKLSRESVKQSPLQSKRDLGDFRISITEFDEDTPEDQDESPKIVQVKNQLSIQRVNKQKSLRNIPSKGKQYQLNALLHSVNDTPKRDFKKIKFIQQFSMDNEQPVPIDPESPKKYIRPPQSNKVMLPALTESTQTSLSPLKLKQKPQIIKQNSFRKSETSFFMGLSRLNNESETGAIKNKLEIQERTQNTTLNSQRFSNRNTFTYSVVSPKNTVTPNSQSTLLFPKKII